jgi:hypothetical protein
MKKILRLFFIPLLIGLSTSSFAQTATKKKPPEKQTEAAAIPAPVYNVDGIFRFCVMEYTYPEQNKLSMAMSQNKDLNLATSIAGAGFEKGKKYSVTLQLDGQEIEKVEAPAINEETLLFRRADDPSFSTLFNKSKALEVVGNGATIALPLAPLGKILSKLDQCVEKNKNAKRAATPKSLPPEIPPALAVLFQKAGITGIEPLSLSDVPADERPADFVWKKDKLTGGFTQKTRSTPITGDEMIGLYLKGLEAECPRAFFVSLEKEVSKDNIVTRLASTRCTIKDEIVIFDALLFIYRKDDPLFTIITHEAPLSESAAALAAARSLRVASFK